MLGALKGFLLGFSLSPTPEMRPAAPAPEVARQVARRGVPREQQVVGRGHAQVVLQLGEGAKVGEAQVARHAQVAGAAGAQRAAPSPSAPCPLRARSPRMPRQACLSCRGGDLSAVSCPTPGPVTMPVRVQAPRSGHNTMARKYTLNIFPLYVAQQGPAACRTSLRNQMSSTALPHNGAIQ